MTTLLYTHPACLQHLPGPGHPESPARLQAVLEALDDDRFAALDRIEAPRRRASNSSACTTPELIDCIAANAPRAGFVASSMRTP